MDRTALTLLLGACLISLCGCGDRHPSTGGSPEPPRQNAAVQAAEPKLSSCRIPAEEVGNDWAFYSRGNLVIDDLDAPPQEPKELRELAEMLQKQLQPRGVKAVADFTYCRKKDPGHLISVQIFVFKSAEPRRQLMKAKYQFEGWEKKYRKVEIKGCEAYDSLEMKKRIVGFGDTMLSVGTIENSEEYLKVVDLYRARLKMGQEYEAAKVP